MYISKLTFTKKQFALIKGYDRYILHQYVSNIFDESCQFWIDDKKEFVDVIVYSTSTSKVNPTECVVKTKEFKKDLSVGLFGKIKCTTNIAKTGKNKNEKIPIVKSDEVIEWILKNQECWGIKVNQKSILLNDLYTISTKKKFNSWKIVYRDIEFGYEISDSEKFRCMLQNGIGKSKKFGFGLIRLSN